MAITAWRWNTPEWIILLEEKGKSLSRILHKFNIPFDLHLIFGLPFQSLRDFLASYDRAREAHPRGLYVFPLNVLKGTQLYWKRDEWEYKIDTEDNNIFLQSKWMEKREVAYLKEVAKGINQSSKQSRYNGELLQLPDLREGLKKP